MADEIIYLGFKINKNGVTPAKENIENIKTTKEQRNVSELKSFLGLIYYYHRYFKNFSETLKPLHELLRKVLNGNGCRNKGQRLKKPNL